MHRTREEGSYHTIQLDGLELLQGQSAPPLTEPEDNLKILQTEKQNDKEL